MSPIEEIQRLLGPVVLLKCVGKRPVAESWQLKTLADMTAGYLAGLVGGNIGVNLGEPSQGLSAIDIDKDELVERFLNENPDLVKTFQTRGNRGRVFWVRFQGRYPKTSKLVGANGESVGEFRSTGAQSIVYGVHPDTGKSYRWLNDLPALQIEFETVNWTENLSLKVQVSKEHVSHTVGGVVGGGVSVGSADVLTNQARRDIDRAIVVGINTTKQNNAASFQAAVALCQIRGVNDLTAIPNAERQYFAREWYARLHALGRTNPKKGKLHYMSDIYSSVKNARRDNCKNPLKQAWNLALNEPLPQEANEFSGDEVTQRLIALCFQLSKVSENGEFFLSRKTFAELLGKEAPDTRTLKTTFQGLVGAGILEVAKPGDAKTRVATTYRYCPQVIQP